MPKGTFNNKLSDKHPTTFSGVELNKLCAVLIEMRDELGIVEGADFNDALKILTQKPV